MAPKISKSRLQAFEKDTIPSRMIKPTINTDLSRHFIPGTNGKH